MFHIRFITKYKYVKERRDRGVLEVIFMFL